MLMNRSQSTVQTLVESGRLLTPTLPKFLLRGGDPNTSICPLLSDTARLTAVTFSHWFLLTVSLSRSNVGRESLYRDDLAGLSDYSRH